MNEITPLSKAEKALAAAKTPDESKQVEALAAAAKAWAKEQDDFEKVVLAARIYILARRKTTELIVPNIRQGQYGREGNDNVTFLSDYGFTKMQWSRRKKELEEVTLDDIDYYIDECIEKGIEPTVYGLLRYATEIIPDSTGDEWWTPSVYIESVRKVLGEIDLDPASCESANQVVRAKQIYTEADSGLNHEWRGRVFMNPPYSQNKAFAEKMLEELKSSNVSAAIVLVGAHAIETQWFSGYWDYVLCFTGHRIKFDTPQGPQKAGNIAGSVFIYLGSDQYKFADEFKKHGYVVKRWPES